MYSISQNPYFFKSLTNFEVNEGDNNTSNMSCSFLASNKSKSLIYRFVLERLRELASLEELVKLKLLKKLKELEKPEEFENIEEVVRQEVLDYKYDEEKSSIQINICENYFFGCIMDKEKNVDINDDFCKFILAKMCSSFYHYLMFHRCYIPSKLESRVESMMKYMENYEHSKNIKIKNVVFELKLFSKNLIDIVFKVISCSTFPEICLKILYDDISNCLIKPFSKIMKLPACSVQKVIIFDKKYT